MTPVERLVADPLRGVVAVISAATVLTGLVQLVAPGTVLDLLGAESTPTTRQLFAIVGMFMVVVGGVTLQALLTEPTPAYVVLWCAAAEARRLCRGHGRGDPGPVRHDGDGGRAFDLLTALLAGALWWRLRSHDVARRERVPAVKRSLVLAGGGMRVAWQTGVVQALTEHGLEFQHVDGTSGGIMTTGMLLSGQQPAEMGRRWSDLDVRDFSSPLPVRDYLRGPWALPGLGDSDGVVHKVFPHLGIDCEAIRSSPVAGTFNVVDFVTKTCVAVPHTDVDESCSPPACPSRS